MNNKEFNDAYRSLFESKVEVCKGVFKEVFTHDDEVRLKSLKTQVSYLEQKKERINRLNERNNETEYKLTGASNLKSRY